MSKKINWTEIVSDFQCDVICQVELHRIKGHGVVCGGCDSFVSLINEKQAQQIEEKPEKVNETIQTWLDDPSSFN